MGADFLLFSLPWTQLDAGRQKMLDDAIDLLTGKQLRDVADVLDCDDLPGVREALHAAVCEYADLDGRRDTTSCRYPSDPYWRIYTGGLSWGDEPTDCCRTFEAIAQCDTIYGMIEDWAKEDGCESQTCSPLHAVVAEFCRDVEAVGRDHLAERWPDLAVTYDKAAVALTTSGAGPSLHSADIAGIMTCLCNALTDKHHGVEGCVVESSDNDNDSGEVFIDISTGDGATDSYLIKVAPR